MKANLSPNRKKALRVCTAHVKPALPLDVHKVFLTMGRAENTLIEAAGYGRAPQSLNTELQHRSKLK